MSVGYYRHPTIHGDRIVFVCEDDLWSVSVDGGIARRLTCGMGAAAFPKFSPDGESLVFTGRDDGPAEVCLIPSEGGELARMTWLGAATQTVGFSPDGESILFQSNAGQAFNGAMHLHAVPTKGGASELLPFGPARDVSYEPDGPGVVLGINSGDPARWKRYRGGTAGRILVDRVGDGTFGPLIKLDGNLAAPMWIGNRIYFLSDHEGHGNLYSCTPSGRGLRRHTDHQDYYVRFPSTDGERIVYQCGADLHVYSTDEERAELIDIKIHSPRTERRRKFVSARDWLESADLHPEGHSIAVTSRGGSFTMPLWEGAHLRHDLGSGARYRLTSWLPDGKRLVAISDAEGEECIVTFRADGRGKPKAVEADVGRAHQLAVAPAGADRVALTNHRLELMLVDLSKGEAKRVDASRFGRMEHVSWSPDGRYLAYDFPTGRSTSCIRIHDTETGRSQNLTKPDFKDHHPSWDPDGKFLYFLSARVFDPVYDTHYFDLGYPRGMRPYLVLLANDTRSPFSLTTKTPQAPRSDPKGGDGPDAPGPLKVRVDLDGIERRIVAFPVEEGIYEQVFGSHGRVWFTSLPVEGSLDVNWRDGGAPAAHAMVEMHDFETEKTEALHEPVTSIDLSMDGKTLLLRSGNDLRALSASLEPKDVPSGEELGRETGWLDIERMRIEVDPETEWEQMYREAWRLQRDQFWTKDMGKVNWRRVHDRYAAVLPRVTSRSEFSDLMWEMQGELGTSHCYEMGGDYWPPPAWNQGFLGADLELVGNRPVWQIKKIPRGDSWEREAVSPLAEPGLGIVEGDVILEVNGQPVGPKRPPGCCLVDMAGRRVSLLLKSQDGKRRQVAVRTLEAEMNLRYRDWVEANRERVHRESKGKLGYVHVPNMGPRGHAEFHRYYRSEFEHEGLVIDVRWNGGGHVSSLLLEMLLRRRIGYDEPRWGEPAPYPDESPMGPMVALTNEYAGSDGDIFSHCFKLYGLGPLIGTRTWGGVVGIWPRHALVDGTMTTQPEFSFWFEDVGWNVENYGTDPDIEVPILPQDHAAGEDPQLERGIAEALKRVRTERPGVPKLDRRPRLAPPRLPKR